MRAPYGRSQSWRKRFQALERDKELLLQSYTIRAPEALDSLGPEERRKVYSMLGLRVDALPGKSLRVQGAFGEEYLVCHHDRTSRRTNQNYNKFCFEATLRDGLVTSVWVA